MSTEGAVYLKNGQLVGVPPAGQVALLADASGNIKKMDSAGAQSAVGGGGAAVTDATLTGDGSAGSPLGINPPVAIAKGGTGQTTAIAALNALATMLTGQKVQFITPDAGIARVVEVFAQNAAGDPAFSWRTGVGAGTEQGYARGDTGGAVTFVPRVVGVLTAADEAAVLMTWTKTTVGFFGATRVAQQAVGAGLTDNTTGGTAGVLSATDDATNRQGNFHQLAIKVAALETALRNYGLATT